MQFRSGSIAVLLLFYKSSRHAGFGLIHSTIYEDEHPGKRCDSGPFRGFFMLQYTEGSTRIGSIVLVFDSTGYFHSYIQQHFCHVLHMSMKLSSLANFGMYKCNCDEI